MKSSRFSTRLFVRFREKRLHRKCVRSPVLVRIKCVCACVCVNKRSRNSACSSANNTAFVTLVPFCSHSPHEWCAGRCPNTAASHPGTTDVLSPIVGDFTAPSTFDPVRHTNSHTSAPPRVLARTPPNPPNSYPDTTNRYFARSRSERRRSARETGRRQRRQPPRRPCRRRSH